MGCVRGFPRKTPGKSREHCWIKFYPNRKMLQILGFRAPEKANLPRTLGRHSRDLVPTFRAGCFLKSTVPAFSSFSEFQTLFPTLGPKGPKDPCSRARESQRESEIGSGQVSARPGPILEGTLGSRMGPGRAGVAPTSGPGWVRNTVKQSTWRIWTGPPRTRDGTWTGPG